MTTYTSKIDFTLQTPITFHKQGVEDKTYNVILVAPSNRNRIETGKIKQMFLRAIADMQGKFQGGADAKSGGDSEITGQQALSLILMSDKVDYAELQDAFFKLAINGCVKLTESINMTKDQFDSILESDAEGMIAAYIESFLLPSLMKMTG